MNDLTLCFPEGINPALVREILKQGQVCNYRGESSYSVSEVRVKNRIPGDEGWIMRLSFEEIGK